MRKENSQGNSNSLRPLRDFIGCSLCGKTLLLFALVIIISSCSRKRAPAKGCDCPGGHGMLKENKTPEPAAALYLKSGNSPS